MSEKSDVFRRDYLKVVREIYQPFSKVMLVIFGQMCLMQALAVTQPYIFGRMLDVLLSQRGYATLIAFAATFFLVKGGHLLASYIKDRYEINNFDWAVERWMHEVALKRVFSFSLGQHHNQHSGVKQNIISTGQQALVQLAHLVCYQILPLMIQIVFTLAALFYCNLFVGGLVLASAALHIAVTLKINRSIRCRLREVDGEYKESSRKQAEILRNVPLVMVNVRQKAVTDDFIDHWDKISSMSRKIWLKFSSLEHGRRLLVAAIDLAAVMLGACLVHAGKMTPGEMMTIAFLVNGSSSRLEGFSDLQRQTTRLMSSVNKYIDLLKIECDIELPEKPIRPKLSGKVVFKDVSFKYPARSGKASGNEAAWQKEEADEVLTEIDLTIEPGRKVAFVGHSGAGKSTLVNLLLRAYDPSRGAIEIDGVDLRDIDLCFYRNNIGLVEQQVELFDETLRYNIAFGLRCPKVDASDEQLDWAARIARVNEFLGGLEHGYDTVLGEKGVKLSGGQRQRVGIARALVGKPKILIFDEATSNLDAENEALIHKAIREAAKGRTTIIIAHRLSTIMDADMIVVMNQGRIVSVGTHDELIECCYRYRSLVNNQVSNI